MREFKKGDKLLCIESSPVDDYGQSVNCGHIYTFDSSRGDRLLIKEHRDSTVWYNFRFILAKPYYWKEFYNAINTNRS